MTRNLSRSQSVKLGLVVAACIALGVWGLIRVAGKAGWWSDGYEVTVIAADAQDVEPGTPVRVRGIEAGRVIGVDYAEDQVYIRARLDGKFRDRLYADATASIQTKGMLGASVVDIKPGSANSGPLTEPVVHAKSTPDLAEVTKKLASVADRADAVLKDVQDGKGTLPKLLKDDDLYKDLKAISTDTKKLVKNLDETTTALRGDAQKTMQGVGDSVDAVRNELEGLKTFVRSGQEAVSAIKQDAEAIKSMPIVRSYVEDNVAILVRPDCEKDRVIYSPDDFFHPGTSLLTEGGKAKLNECAGWLNGQQQKKSEIVVASFADSKAKELTAASARTLTKKQAEVITEYLKDHGVHKMGYVTRRKVTPVGQGFDPSPVVEKDPLPAARVEVILFVPRS